MGITGQARVNFGLGFTPVYTDLLSVNFFRLFSINGVN